MALNNLAASPGFSRWTEGEALDIGAMLFTAQGKPRVSIFSIAHLNDAERMFFVSLLLNQTLGWVRQQSGTSSLRAILYMDEIAGYSADGEPAQQAAAADADEAGEGLRPGRGAGDAEPCGPSITRAWPTRARGSSGGCRRSATRRGVLGRAGGGDGDGGRLV